MTKYAANSYYFTTAMLYCCRKYLQDLVADGEVSGSLKQDFNALIAQINRHERTANNSLSAASRTAWIKEFKARDYEVFANIFSTLNNMDEQQREVAEQFMQELQRGNVEIEITK